MKHPIVICRYGPGISHAVAQLFGWAGHPVAIIARNAHRLADGVAALEAEGIKVQAFMADLSNVKEVQRTIADVRAAMGSIGILHWNAYTNIEGSLLLASPNDLSNSLSVRIIGYITAVQECLADLEANQGAVLATSGAMAFYGAEIDAFAKDFGILAISVAAQHKATGILTETLKPHGIYVGEVIVNGFVKSTESGNEHHATLEPNDIANQFWKMNAMRKTHSIVFGENLAAQRR